MSQKTNNTLPIVMMFFLFAMISFVTGFSNPMGVIIKQQPGISNWMTQLGNFGNFFAYLIMGWPAGIILKRKGYKWTALTALLIGIVGVGLQLLASYLSNNSAVHFTTIFSVYLAGAFIAGLTMCMLNTVVNPMLNTLAGGGKKGNQLMQFGGSLNSLCAALVPYICGVLIGKVTAATKLSAVIPALWIALIIFAVVFVVLTMVRIPEPHRIKKEDEKAQNNAHSPFAFRHFKLGIVAIFLYVGLEVGFANFMNMYLTNPLNAAGAAGLGIAADIAGSIVGIYWLLMLVGRLLGGIVGGKYSANTQLVVVSSLAIILTLIGIILPKDIVFTMNAQQIPVAFIFFVLCGLCTSVMWGSLFNLAVEGLGKYTAVASGIFMVMVVGGGILPLVQGAVADIFSNYAISFSVEILGLAYILYYALIGHKNVNSDIPVD